MSDPTDDTGADGGDSPPDRIPNLDPDPTAGGGSLTGGLLSGSDATDAITAGPGTVESDPSYAAFGEKGDLSDVDDDSTE